MSRGNPNDARPARNSISATQLSELAVCQLMVQLNQRGGAPTPSVERQQRLALGTEMHNRSEQAAIEASTAAGESSTATDTPVNRKGPCFIASSVYGPTHVNTTHLRAWRDRALRPHRLGRVLIGLYYRLSPPVARWLGRSPHRAAHARAVLDRVTAILKVRP